MDRRIVSTTGAPSAVGPYSQGVLAGGFLFTAGQIGLDPQTGRLISDLVEDQARQALSNLRAVLEGAGLSLHDVVKSTVFLTSMDDFATVNEVYGEAFGEEPPARSAVAVAALPLGARVEIELIARSPAGRGARE